MKHRKSLGRAAVAAVVLLAAAVMLAAKRPAAAVVDLPQFLPEQDLSALRRLVPEKLTRISKQDLIERVPNFYYFDYTAQPLPGKRLWLRISRQKWIERYPNGLESTFVALGHATVNDVGGTIVAKTAGDEEVTGTPNDGRLQAFIPDRGGERMHHLYRNTEGGNTDWTDLGEMRSVQ
jgi:hypothetical protein